MSAEFYSKELQQSLSKQSFGIAGFEVLPPTSSFLCAAKVHLLEGYTILISISPAGYRVDEDSHAHAPSTQVHESAEELLQATSPRYADEWGKQLAAKLEALTRE